LKKKNSAVIFTVSALLTVGVFTYNNLESKAKATSDLNVKDNMGIHKSDRSTEIISNEPVQTAFKQKTMDEEKVPVVDGVNKKASSNVEQSIVERSQAEDKKPVKCGTGTTTKVKETKTVNPETRVIDGYTFVNITDSAEENLADLIEVAKKHNAALYAIEYSDSFAMYSNDTGEPLIMFSTGSRSVSVEHAAILYDMHPSIKEQIKTVVDTGNETIVELGEFESYRISKTDGRIYLSF
jgi:hypothetical protein